ncbi:FAD-dependent monooxygenase [Saccharothrix syringae]|uniref:Monooxygenase n=1 Tax=Saccharothrix syringae TaxID=103733 RepID=A0A5Q0GZF2_SACSY|nr:FAD-dependent monooxygenase [Saccharothrix syringae]QFZ18920.1 monooxygenase [Saccharothrix syringae]
MDVQVAVVGGGPVGLWLAAELRLGGASVVVLESRSEPDPRSKALTLHPRTLELLASRGLGNRFLAEGARVPAGHFAVLEQRLDFSVLDTPFPFTLVVPQARTERLFEEHARDLGVDVRRGQRVTGVVPGEDSVTVHVDGHDLVADYVVGCDGTRSTVRAAAGIPFSGTPSTVWGWLADVVLDEPPTGTTSWVTEDGLVMVVRLAADLHRVVGITPADVRADRPGEPTLAELRAKTAAVAGTDFGMRDPVWLSRFGDASRLADRYRAGRLLLAGDAAHQHFPAGGVGLNVGVQDAANLGWKLAAVVRGRAPEALLDTYEAERRRVGADLLDHTRAQTALMTAFTPRGLALRGLVNRLVATHPGVSADLAGRLSGLAVTYPAAEGDHPLVGRRAPHGDGLLAALRPDRYVLLDLTGTLGDVDGVVVLRGEVGDRPGWRGVRAALVRPDGHVAWADRPDDDLPAATRAAVAALPLILGR